MDNGEGLYDSGDAALRKCKEIEKRLGRMEHMITFIAMRLGLPEYVEPGPPKDEMDDLIDDCFKPTNPA